MDFVDKAYFPKLTGPRLLNGEVEFDDVRYTFTGVMGGEGGRRGLRDDVVATEVRGSDGWSEATAKALYRLPT